VGGRPLIQGTFDASTRAKTGSVVFDVRASHLAFNNLEFSHVGECFRFGVATDGVSLSRFRAVNVATAVNIVRGGTFAVTHLTISQAMILQFTRGGIFLGANSDGVLIEDSYLDMQPEQIGGQGSDYPVGIALYDNVQNVVIRNSTVMNVIGMTTGYSQGDGIDGEVTANGIEVRDSYFRGSQDGCIDTKANNMVISDTVAVGCKRNFRLWQRAAVGPRCVRCTSYAPKDAHVFASGGVAQVTTLTTYSNDGADLFVRDDSLGGLVVNGLEGTLGAASNISSLVTVTGNNLIYGQGFTLPPIPNPTPFTP